MQVSTWLSKVALRPLIEKRYVPLTLNRKPLGLCASWVIVGNNAIMPTMCKPCTAICLLCNLERISMLIQVPTE